MNQNKWKEILKGKTSVAIGGHERPDGDCIGSCTGLYLYLKQNYENIEVDLYLEQIPETFQVIRGTEHIRHSIPEEKQYDLFICLDCGDKERLGFSVQLFQNAGTTLCIDHHISNTEFADFNYIVPDASSTSELIYNLLDEEKITLGVAEALYLGIVHDTGVFQYSCAGPSTFRAAANCWKRAWMRRVSSRIRITRRPMPRTRFSAGHCWKAFYSWKADALHPISQGTPWTSMA